MADVICLGDLLIDFVPTVTGLAWPTRRDLQEGGGRGAGQRRGRSGAPRRGERFHGQGRRGRLRPLPRRRARRGGVDVGTLRFTEARRTALAFVSLRADGEREFLFYRSPSADMLFAPDDVDEAAISAGQGAALRLDQPHQRAVPLGHAARGRGGNVTGAGSATIPICACALWPDAEAARAGMRLGLEARGHRQDRRGRGGFPDRHRTIRSRGPAHCGMMGSLSSPSPEVREAASG